MDSIIGAECILIQDNCLILGFQKCKRWYNYKNEKAAIIKTIGGKLEDIDNNNTCNTLVREMNEEICNVHEYFFDKKDLFIKKIDMCNLNPFDRSSKLKMEATFYKIIINKNCNIYPNDLPFLLKIPFSELKKFNFGVIYDISMIKKYIIFSKNSYKLPKYFSFFIPDEVRKYFYE